MKSPRPHKGGYTASAKKLMTQPKPVSSISGGRMHCEQDYAVAELPNTTRRLTFCVCCKHISTYLNEGYGSATCEKGSEVVDFVRGEISIEQVKCRTKNTKGECTDFTLKKKAKKRGGCDKCEKPCLIPEAKTRDFLDGEKP